MLEANISTAVAFPAPICELVIVSCHDTVIPMEEREIGANIRRLRQERGLTVTAVARRAALSKGTVSKIETGSSSPPVATLLRIATALNVPLARLFAEQQADPPFVLTRKGRGRIITRDGTRFGYSYTALALEAAHKTMEPFLLTIRPGDPVGRFEHGGEEFIYMLDGQLEFTVGESELVLHRGDALYFDPTQVHTTRAVGRKAAQFLCMFVQERPVGGAGAHRRNGKRRRKA